MPKTLEKGYELRKLTYAMSILIGGKLSSVKASALWAMFKGKDFFRGEGEGVGSGINLHDGRSIDIFKL